MANKIPGSALRHVVQYLPDHDARALEGWLAMANQRVRDDVPSHLNSLSSAVLAFPHKRNLCVGALAGNQQERNDETKRPCGEMLPHRHIASSLSNASRDAGEAGQTDLPRLSLLDRR